MPEIPHGPRLIKAAGAVAWRPGPDGEPEVLLVHRRRYGDWSLPKGKTEPGEPLPFTAVREVLEEGGARLALGRRLLSVRYNVGGRPKRVHYWAARAASVDEGAVPNAEVDEVTWLPVARAAEKASYAHDHRVLADFAARPAATVPVILLRHARAVAKDGWAGADEARPLDEAGRGDAGALAGLLSCFGCRPRLVSSTALRCLDTVRPLARLAGAELRAEPWLALRAAPPAGGAAGAVAALVREAVTRGEPAVICAHRENLPALQAAALAALSGHRAAACSGPGDAAAGPGPAAEIPRDWGDDLPTSGFWVLNVTPRPAPPGAGCPAGVLVSADRYDPPPA